jgi:precorrin-2/cobalt-factor-2 C20-methyltransferase
VNGTFFGIGVGPGDPELCTLKARRLLDKADVVYAPKSRAGRASLAVGIVQPFLRPDCQIRETVFPMTKDRAVLEESWEAAAEEMAAELQAGQNVAFLTLGDPTLYSTYGYILTRLLERGYDAETVPGVTSITAAAAALNLTLAEGDQALAILPSTADLDRLRAALRSFDTVVLLKVAKNLPEVSALLQSATDRRAYLVSQVGLPEQRVVTDLSEVEGEKLAYLSLLIITRRSVRA